MYPIGLSQSSKVLGLVPNRNASMDSLEGQNDKYKIKTNTKRLKLLESVEDQYLFKLAKQDEDYNVTQRKWDRVTKENDTELRLEKKKLERP